MKSKRGFEFSFAWFFAIIVGAVIIFFAIYASTKFINTERTSQDTILGKELGIVLNPVETSIETGKSTIISLPIETRIYNECDSKGTFGTQEISTSTKSGIGEEWQKPGFPSSFHNKYIFSNDIIEGKYLFVFAMQIEMPFKIADLLYIWSDKQSFCFVNPPNEIEDDIISLQLNNVNITQFECRGSTNICFSPKTGCDIDVSIEGKSVKKKGYPNRVFYETPPLMYAAIFSSPDIYECQLSRLMKRTAEISLLQQQKTIFLAPRGCNSNLESDLILFANQTLNFENTENIKSIYQNSEIIRKKNDALSCKIF